MSKIVTAINRMIAGESNISNVMRGYDSVELFFMYDKYKWSIIKREAENYSLHYYPGNQTLEELASLLEEAWPEFGEMVSYRDDVLGTKEARSSLSELYTIIQEKLFGMDEVLDDIIGPDF